MAVPYAAPGPEEPVGPEPESALKDTGLAEPAQRLVARIVDTLVVGLPVVAVVRAVVPSGDVDVVAPPAVAAVLLLYEAVQLAVWGRTLGKRFAGIEVIQDPVIQDPVIQDPVTRSESAGGSKAAAGAGTDGDSRTAARAETAEAGLGDGTAAVVPDGGPAPLTRGPGALQSLLRAAVYALPIAARPVPVFGVLAGVLWVANAGLLFEGVRRQALHDRLAGTLVVKRR